eukprot:m.131913 g.131913  ORF g.131913 m.131913 type:complete len:438 (-) comp13777_c0_seq3:837-2150(-)
MDGAVMRSEAGGAEPAGWESVSNPGLGVSTGETLIGTQSDPDGVAYTKNVSANQSAQTPKLRTRRALSQQGNGEPALSKQSSRTSLGSRPRSPPPRKRLDQRALLMNISSAILSSVALALLLQAVVSERWVVGHEMAPTRRYVEVGILRSCSTPEGQGTICHNVDFHAVASPVWQAAAVTLALTVWVLASTAFAMSLAVVAEGYGAGFGRLGSRASLGFVLVSIILVPAGFGDLDDSCDSAQAEPRQCGLSCNSGGSMSAFKPCDPFVVSDGFWKLLGVAVLIAASVPLVRRPTPGNHSRRPQSTARGTAGSSARFTLASPPSNNGLARHDTPANDVRGVAAGSTPSRVGAAPRVSVIGSPSRAPSDSGPLRRVRPASTASACSPIAKATANATDAVGGDLGGVISQPYAAVSSTPKSETDARGEDSSDVNVQEHVL